jgi:hypothetical protein
MLSVILIFSCSTINAHETSLKGYVVDLNGDSTFGEVFMIDRYANSQNIYFQPTGSDSMQRYYPHEIKRPMGTLEAVVMKAFFL